MAYNPKFGSRTNRKGGKEQLERLFKDINRKVDPYPKIDVQEKTLPDVDEKWSRRRETPGGKVVELVSVSSVGLLTAITLYAMISHDREMLFAVLGVSKFAMGALLAWALGKTVSNLLHKGGGKRNEENEDTG